MQIVSNRINEIIPKFECEVCGDKLNKKVMKDIIIFIHGNIEHDIQANKVFRENTQTIYIHKNCMKLILDDKFHEIWEKLSNNLL